MQEGEALSAVSFSRKLYTQWHVEEAEGGTNNGKVMAGPAGAWRIDADDVCRCESVWSIMQKVIMQAWSGIHITWPHALLSLLRAFERKKWQGPSVLQDANRWLPSVWSFLGCSKVKFRQFLDLKVPIKRGYKLKGLRRKKEEEREGIFF